MNHAETLDAVLRAGILSDAVITLDGSMFVGATANPLLVLGVLCCGEGGATPDELAALTGLDPDTFTIDRPMPDHLDEDAIHLALGKLTRVWLAVMRNELAETIGLRGRETLPGIVPAVLAEVLQRTAPVRIAPAKVAA